MWCSLPPVRRVTLPILLTLSRADPVVGVAGPVAGDSLRPGAVSGSGGGPVRQRAVRPLVVIDAVKASRRAWSWARVGGLGGLGGEPVLQGLLEPLHFPLGLRVVRAPVLLPDAQAAQVGFQAVAAAPAAGEPGGEDHPVVRQRRRRSAVGGGRGAERGHDDGPGDPVVRGQGQHIPGVVIKPGQDLGARPASEGVMREVSLPALVRQLGSEADVRRPRALGRLGSHQPGPGQVPADRCRRDLHLVVVLQVPADRVRPGVQALPGQLLTQSRDQGNGGVRDGPGRGRRAPRPWLERCLALTRYRASRV